MNEVRRFQTMNDVEVETLAKSVEWAFNHWSRRRSVESICILINDKFGWMPEPEWLKNQVKEVQLAYLIHMEGGGGKIDQSRRLEVIILHARKKLKTCTDNNDASKLMRALNEAEGLLSGLWGWNAPLKSESKNMSIQVRASSENTDKADKELQEWRSKRSTNPRSLSSASQTLPTSSTVIASCTILSPNKVEG